MRPHMRTSSLFVVSLLLGLGNAHNCENGERVVCHDVEGASRAPSTFGEGKSARGYPLLFPDGRRVYCLVDHDYHECEAGQEPCCLDGSKPLHGDRNALIPKLLEEAEKAVLSPRDQPGAEEGSSDHQGKGPLHKDEDSLEAAAFAAPLLRCPSILLASLLLMIVSSS